MYIATATNFRYKDYCAAMIASVCANTKSPSQIVFTIMIREKNGYYLTQYIKTLTQKFKCTINIVHLKPERFIGLKTSIHKTADAYSKVFAPKIVNAYTKRLLYLDCDIIVIKDIKELWQSNLNLKIVGAVRDTFYETAVVRKPLFNSGVMLIDVEKYIGAEIEEQVVSAVRRNDPTGLWLADQDELNDILVGLWEVLPAKWNVASADFASKNTQAKNPSIIHFTGPAVLKPDHLLCDNPYKKTYYTYASMVFPPNPLIPFIPIGLARLLRIGLFYAKKLTGSEA